VHFIRSRWEAENGFGKERILENRAYASYTRPEGRMNIPRAGEMIGKTLGHYRVGEQLGRGGMGEVYLADDISLDRKVALKYLPDIFKGDPERMAHFKCDASLLALPIIQLDVLEVRPSF
jgi:serine/threonine protein kinase